MTSPRHLVYQAYLYALAFTLIGMGVVGLAGSLRIQHSALHALVLNPDSMLLSPLLGAALLAAVRHRVRVLRIICAALLAMTLYSILDNALAGHSGDTSWLSDSLHARSGLALTGLLLTIAIWLVTEQPRIRWLGQVLGLSAALVDPAAQIMGWTPILESAGTLSSASSPVGILTVLLAMAVVLLAWLPYKRERELDRQAIVAGAIGTLLTCLSLYLLNLQTIESVSRESELLLEKVQSTVERNVQERLALMQRMAERWQALGALPEPVLWQQEARSYLRDYPSLQALAVLDENLRPLWVEARDDQQEYWLEQFLAGTGQWFMHVREEHFPHLSEPHRLADGQSQVLVAAPIWLPTLPNGFLVASLDIQRSFFEALAPDLSGFGVRAYDGGTLVFSSLGHGDLSVGTRELPLHHDVNLLLQTYVASPGELYASTHFSTLVMLCGLSLSFLLILSQRLASLARIRARRLKATSLELGKSLDRQLRLQALNQRIIDFSLDVVCSVDRQGRFCDLSPACEAVLGYRAEELIGRPFIDFVLPEDRSRTREEAAAIMSGRATRSFHNRYRRKDGRIVHILWSAGWSPEEEVIFAVAHDITHMMQYEMFAEHQRDILGMVTSDRSLTQTLEAICLMVQAQEPKALASVLLAAEGERLVTGAAPDLPADYSQAIDGLKISDARACAAAAFHRRLVVSEDLAQDPLWQDFRSLTLKHGLRACWALPLMSHHGTVLGTLAVYMPAIQTPNEDQIGLMEAAAQLAAIAIVRKRDRQRLQESEQRFRSLFAFNPDPVVSFDLAGRIQSINDAGLALSGYDAGELDGQHFSGFVADDDRTRVTQHFAAACAGKPQRYELLGRDRQHNPRMLDMTNLPIVVDGQIVGVFGIAKDISERKQAQQETLRLAERLTITLESISDAFHTFDNDWRFTFVNSESARLLGMCVQDMLGAEVWSAFPGSRESEVGERFLRAAERQEAEHFETFYEPLGLWLEVHAYPSEEGLAVYFQDISERKRTEHALQTTLEELERSNRELEEFAFVASHDLQEPLRKIQAFSERLEARASGLDDVSHDYLRRMTSAAARMQALIIDLLDYSRVNTRGQPFQRLQLGEIVKEVLQDMETTLEQSRAQIECAWLPSVMGDPSQMRRVVQNLLSNAVKFQPPKARPVIRIYAERESADAWTLCVENNGIGFDEKYLDRIFNPFQRLHGRDAYAGTGIGLAIVKKIAERHGGGVTANSSPGRGSVFRLIFPNIDEACA
ncbi:PAS domain S-box protein [Stutzerimonas azotifigens]|uniref:PAS domain S-box protein n=1 Tax=Stutzerimonas azotifigens TaxID=291995 RepID=UPI0003FCF1BB|nr:PAS domain S-box protein [Stutzerimonas azotifigens]